MKSWTELSRWVVEPARPTFEPSTASASLFLFLLPGPDTRDPPVSDSVPLTCGPSLTVDLVNIDQVNADVIKGHDDVSI